MPRAYPPRRRVRASSRARSGGTFGWMLFGIFIGLTVAIFGYWKLVLAPTQQTSSLSSQPQTPHKTIAALKKEKPAAPVATTPEFDFYTVLPKMEVAATTKEGITAAAKSPVPSVPPTRPVAVLPASTSTPQVAPLPPPAAPPAAETKVASTVVKQLPAEPVVASAAPTETKTPALKPAVSTTYVLQLGIFKNYADADHLKAVLTMSGLEVSIQPYTRNGQAYSRVVMGPYASKTAASEQRMALQKNNISSVLVKVS